jgi:hypothetical protein
MEYASNLEESFASSHGASASVRSGVSGLSKASTVTKEDLLSQLDEEINADDQMLSNTIGRRSGNGLENSANSLENFANS